MVNLSAVASATTTATSSTKIVALWIKRDPLRDRSFFYSSQLYAVWFWLNDTDIGSVDVTADISLLGFP